MAQKKTVKRSVSKVIFYSIQQGLRNMDFIRVQHETKVGDAIEYRVYPPTAKFSNPIIKTVVGVDKEEYSDAGGHNYNSIIIE